MNKIRDILNEIKWQTKYDLKHLSILYIHRGAPNNVKLMQGHEIVSIEKTFVKTFDAMIPHHRILKIMYDNKTLFERKK
jgi:uncharacterized protein (UPF0248 family)